MLWSSDPVMSLLVLMQSAELDCGHYVGDGLLFFCYDFETGTASDIVATQVPKHAKVGGRLY